jgi:hypothetical protein
LNKNKTKNQFFCLIFITFSSFLTILAKTLPDVIKPFLMFNTRFSLIHCANSAYSLGEWLEANLMEQHALHSYN